ncbi:MAG: hypothetical protein ABIP39_08875 [Polyangiaceae bacterium]
MASFGVALVATAGIIACGGSDATVTADAKLPTGAHSESMDHEACNESGNKVELLDTNNDGKPDIRRVYAGGKEICRISDLNKDGKPEMFEYFDASGQVRRREADYDDSGVVDSIEIFENGKLVQRQLDTSGEHRLDTWDYFDPATGKHTRRERDSMHTGHIDQWWTWEGEKVTIAFDKNGDGKPDPSDTVVLGSVASSSASSTAFPSAEAGAPPSTASSFSLDGGGGALAPTKPTTTDAPILDAGAPKPKTKSKDKKK